VTVPKHRRVAATGRELALVHRTDLAADDLDGRRTSADRTLVDCLRTLPVPDALAVADSALRAGYAPARLHALARDLRGPGSSQARAVAAVADARAANPFESALRALCLDVDGLHVEPQVDIHDPGWLGRPDLVDRRLRIVLEADSFAWHGSAEALERDARRYNALVAAGWLVMRITWGDLMFRPHDVTRTVTAVVLRRTEELCPGCRAA
jgi:very-short-patch-repair endonuclease